MLPPIGMRALFYSLLGCSGGVLTSIFGNNLVGIGFLCMLSGIIGAELLILGVEIKDRLDKIIEKQ